MAETDQLRTIVVFDQMVDPVRQILVVIDETAQKILIYSLVGQNQASPSSGTKNPLAIRVPGSSP